MAGIIKAKDPIQDIEGYVELIEFFISKNKDWADNIAADKHYSVNVMDNAITYESRSSHVNLAAFIKELEAKYYDPIGRDTKK
jgi:hypothetical protein